MENMLIPLKIDNLKVSIKNKKRVLKILVSLFICSILFYCLGKLGIYYKEYMYELSIRNLFNESYYSTKSDVIESIDIVTKLPKKVTDVLIINDVKFSFIPWQPVEGACGQFRSMERLIQVQYLSSSDDNIISKYPNQLTTLHEVAHAFDCDFSLNLVGYAYSGDRIFDNIYKKEAAKLFNKDVIPGESEEYLDYYRKSRWEYFAESFAFYFGNEESNEILLKNAPETYNFIRRVTRSKDEFTFFNYIKEKF